MAQPTRHVIRFGGRTFENDYVFPAEIAALRAHKTGQFQERVILEWIQKQGLKGTYIDVGAHIGNHSLFFAAFCRSDTVFVVEGHPVIFELCKGNLERNLSMNEKAKLRFVDRAAWSDSGKHVDFAPIPKNNAGHTHVVNSGGRSNEKAEVRVETVKLDDLRLDKWPVVVLKIDVEDTEKQVIQGGLGLIKEYKPLIVIERHDKKQLDETMSQLRIFGYKVVERWNGVHTYALRAG